MTSVGTKVFVARLAGTVVFDPLGDHVGRVRDVVVLLRSKGGPRAVGLVIEVPGRKRVFLPLTRVTAIDAGQVLSTGLMNMRRFEQRTGESLVIGELLDRKVRLVDGGGVVTIEDVALEARRSGDWVMSKVFVRHAAPARTGLIRKRGETSLLEVSAIADMAGTGASQSAAIMLAQYEDLKAADLADMLKDLGPTRRLEVAVELSDDRLADVMQEMPEDDQVDILVALEDRRAADVLEAMEPDDAADLLGELPDEQASALLALMEPEEAQDVRRLLAYEDNTAGGLMTTEPVILGPETPIAAALAHVRRQDLTPSLASVVFVARPPLETPTGRFIGLVHIQSLLREPPHQSIGSIVDKSTDVLTTDAPLITVAREMATYNLLALPVVDEQKRLLGAVSIDDVLDHLLPDDWREVDDEEAVAAAEAAAAAEEARIGKRKKKNKKHKTTPESTTTPGQAVSDG